MYLVSYLFVCCAMIPLETLPPPRDPSGGVVYLRIMYVCWFQNVILRCLTPRLHCFLSSQWLSFRFLLIMAFLVPSIQFFFGLPCALLFRHPLQCYFGLSSFCHSLDMAVPCTLVLFNFFYNWFL